MADPVGVMQVTKPLRKSCFQCFLVASFLTLVHRYYLLLVVREEMALLNLLSFNDGSLLLSELPPKNSFDKEALFLFCTVQVTFF